MKSWTEDALKEMQERELTRQARRDAEFSHFWAGRCLLVLVITAIVYFCLH